MTRDLSLTDLRIEYRPIGALHANPRNPRTHSDAQLRRIADSVRQFGFTNPILIDEQDLVLAGHGRLVAAQTLGIETVPTIRLGEMSAAEKRAYVLADNRLAEKAGWDPEILALELRYLATLDVEFDVTITGFEIGEIDVLIQDLGSAADEADDVPEVDPSEPVIARSGDIFILGKHRLLCGDARDPMAYQRLLEGQKAELVFTDPPYNVAIDGHVSGLGQHTHRDFAMGCGEMSPDEFTAFLRAIFLLLVTHSSNGSIHFVCMDWRHLREVLAAGEQLYSDLKNLCIWAKTNGGMGSLYRSAHELVFVFKAGQAPHINNVQLGKHGRYRTNVWTYAGANTFRRGRDKDLAAHPTVKPLTLVADAILDCSKRQGIVLDPFGGSGTTLLAAERTGRQGYLMEIDPLYADLIVRRWEHMTGGQARHLESGLSFADLGALRHSTPPAARAQEVGHG